MKTIRKIIGVFLFLIPLFTNAGVKEVPFTLDDRDRWAIIGLFTTMMISIFGFAFWDRKLSLAPVKQENRKMLMAIRDYAKQQPKLQEILKNAGLL